MALTPIPPWLNVTPETFVDASAKGAGLGLQASQIATGANEAADRLRLSYAQLAAEQAMHGDTTAAARQHASAELALRSTLAQQERQAEFARLGISGRHQDMLEANAADKLKQAGAEKLLHVGQGVYGYDPKTGTFKTKLSPPAGIDPFTRLKYQAALHRRSMNRSALNKGGLDDDVKAAIQKDLDDANLEIQQIESGASGKPSDLSVGTTATASTGSPFAQVPDWFSKLQTNAPDNGLMLPPMDEEGASPASGTNSFAVGKYKVTPLK